MTDIEQVGKRLKELRIKKKLTLVELSEQCKVDYSYIAKLEAGKTNPSLTTLFKILKVLDAKLEIS